VVVTCSFASVSFNLTKSLSTQWSVTLHGFDGVKNADWVSWSAGWVSSVEPSYLTFAFAHRALSASVMVVALLVFIVGKKFTGLTSFFLGLANIISSVYVTAYFYLACGGCLWDKVEQSFGTIIFDLNIVLGLFIGIFGILSGLKAFFKLVTSLLKTILVLLFLIGHVWLYT